MTPTLIRTPHMIALAIALGAGLGAAPAVPAFAQTAADDGQNLTAQAGQTRPQSFADLAQQVSPSVVNITTATTVARNADDGPSMPEGSPFEDFFRDFQDRQEGQRPRRGNALGSGFVISEDGYIVTNNHVIEGADEIMIEFYEGFELAAEVVGTDPNTDIALLKVEPGNPLQFVSFGSSDASRVGDWVMAMGNPLGQGFSVSAGIVSAKARALRGTYDDYIQTDAAINRGNSGGPLFNLQGEVIGVNTAILSPNGGSIGIGFAMSSSVVQNVVDQLQEFGETRRGWLGVRIQDVDPDMVGAIDGLETAEGALVTDVPDGPAAEAGMESGDIILSFDGTDVENTRELVRVVGSTGVGETVRVVVLRNGERETLRVTLARREEAEAVPASAEAEDDAGPSSLDILGMTVTPLTEELREELGADEGVAVAVVAEDSEAYEKGLRQGDVITEAGQMKIEALGDLEARVEEAREAGRRSILLLIRRGGEPRFVAVALGDDE